MPSTAQGRQNARTTREALDAVDLQEKLPLPGPALRATAAVSLLAPAAHEIGDNPLAQDQA